MYQWRPGAILACCSSIIFNSNWPRSLEKTPYLEESWSGGHQHPLLATIHGYRHHGTVTPLRIAPGWNDKLTACSFPVSGSRQPRGVPYQNEAMAHHLAYHRIA
mmetsp:Transcript_65776/g.155832  ORF Transcript_65776/g.155832 Transcript_65776/m.155832 type:complete len:104 (-) Transcript_65776:190-501(-)